MTRIEPILVGLLALVVAFGWLAVGPASLAHANDSDAAPTFHVEVPDGMGGMATALRDAWPRVRLSVGELIGTWHNADVHCYVARNTADMQRILVRLGMPGVRLTDTIAGLAIPSRSLILLNVARHNDGPVITGIVATFRHEYCHLLMGGFAERAGTQWPAWFEEGVCQWVQQSGYQPDAAVLAARDGRIPLPSLDEVSRRIDLRDARTPAAYGFSQNAVGFLMRDIPRADRGGRIADLGEVFVANGGDFPAAFEEVFGLPLAEFEQRWRDHTTPANVFEAVWNFAVYHHITLLFAGCGLIMVLGLWFRFRARRRYMKAPEPVGPPDAIAVAVDDGDAAWSPADVDPEGLIAEVKRARREMHERNRLANLARQQARESEPRP